MQCIDTPLPLPYIVVDYNGKILQYNSLSSNLFNLNTSDISGVIDDESMNKLVKASLSNESTQQIELNVHTKESSLALFDVYLSDDSTGRMHILFVSKEKSNQLYLNKIIELQERLAHTDFELLEQKEKLEDVLMRLNKLSGPFIPLSNKMCYIPLFGDITSEKINLISEHVLHSVFNGEYQNILIDLTAVGEVQDDGIKKLIDLIRTLRFMAGSKIQLIGIQPRLSKILSNYELEIQIIPAIYLTE
ncbi:STAS domain-containing protein [Bacillus sp. D386]|uniref:STAS domain-containing protein n=1 Tax=Bacillus sp. D386 TaxID=2587155 RepID=UPI001120452E|nr:STAS domain-containing protein [Bacillus sp. D386]